MEISELRGNVEKLIKEKENEEQESGTVVHETIRNMCLRVDFRIKQLGSSHSTTLKLLVRIFFTIVLSM